VSEGYSLGVVVLLGYIWVGWKTCLEADPPDAFRVPGAGVDDRKEGI